MHGKIISGPKLESIPISTLGEFLFQKAHEFEDRICQIDGNNDQHETYARFNQRSVRVALALTQLGITHQDVVVLCGTTTMDTPVAVVASLYIAAKVVSLDSSLSVRQTTHLLSLVSPRIIFVEKESIDLVVKSMRKLKLQPELVVFGESTDYIEFSSLDRPQPNENGFYPKSVDVGETSVMFFSSGSTGLPKAICHSHRSFLTLSYCFYKSGDRFDTNLSFSSFYWITAMVFLITSFMAGGRRIICGNVVKAEQLFRCIEKYKITFLFLAPVLTYEVTDFADYKKYDTSSLHTLFSGGTKISTSQMCKVQAIFKHSNFIFAYGLTEAGIFSFFNPVVDKNLMSKKIASCGKPICGYTIKIVDVATKEVLGANQKGEICVKSPTIMNGYYKADSTQVFDSEGFFKTGDVGYFDDDGCLYIVDRLKEMFKYLSWHVVPSVVEQVLLEHPAVKEAVVFGLPKSEEEGEVPTACVVLKNNSEVTEREIQDFVAERVSDKEKLRGGVYFLSEMERTPSGKIMRRNIRDKIIHSLKDN